MKELAEIVKGIPTKKYTPQQLERARRAQQERLARELGLCVFDCQVCAGIGYVRVGDGTLELCPNVDRWSLPSAARYGITKDEAQTLAWTDIVAANGVVRAINEARKTLAWGFGWLYLHGTYGVGKTLILKVAVAEYIRQNKTASYVRMADVLDNLRDGFDDNKNGETARLAWWSEIPLLAIDEFDRIRKTDYGNERRFVLMDRRYEDAVRQQTITLIASNEPPDMLPGYLYDRVRDGRFAVVEINGQSMRPGMEY